MKRRDRQSVNPRWPTPNSSAFTLIELLVVISIVALLMAILLPTVRRVQKQARAVACQAKLRQWGVVFFMYMNDHNEQFDRTKSGHTRWWVCARAYHGNCDDLLLCPMAARFSASDPYSEPDMSCLGSKFAPWTMPPSESAEGDVPLYGSYGWNQYAIMTYARYLSPNAPPPRTPARFTMPSMLDCVSAGASPGWLSAPPAYDGDLTGNESPSKGGMKRFCIDRHDGGVNSLFLDWSVRKVGLKELWTLKWHGGYNTAGPWTKAGGVEPEDWPQWMRRFKDY